METVVVRSDDGVVARAAVLAALARRGDDPEQVEERRRFAWDTWKLPSAGTVWRHARAYGVDVRYEWTAEQADAYRRRCAWAPPHHLVGAGRPCGPDDEPPGSAAAAADLRLGAALRCGGARDASA